MSHEAHEAAHGGLKLHTQTQGDETVIYCAGRLTFEHTEVLKTQGKSLIPHAKRIVVDLKEVEWMDSAGIGTLVGLYVTARKTGCEFILVNYNKAVRDLLGVSHLLSVFEACGRTGMRFP
ncbi:MAG TPA: STAS domain-containing protein [Candidatus Acidoferrales bacterium]|nr:STAS domain-containing protein [Candidatus Acidoferrales bacterium]